MNYSPEFEPENEAEQPASLRDIYELIQTTDTQPTSSPRNVQEQIRIVVSGGNASLYIYDVTNNKWRASTLGT